MNITTWQMSHGGFSKAMESKYKSPWDDSASLSSWYSGTIAINKPVGARAYELPSKSGSESAGILAFLMNWPSQTAAVQKSVKAGLAWYKATPASPI